MWIFSQKWLLSISDFCIFVFISVFSPVKIDSYKLLTILFFYLFNSKSIFCRFLTKIVFHVSWTLVDISRELLFCKIFAKINSCRFLVKIVSRRLLIEIDLVSLNFCWFFSPYYKRFVLIFIQNPTFDDLLAKKGLFCGFFTKWFMWLCYFPLKSTSMLIFRQTRFAHIFNQYPFYSICIDFWSKSIFVNFRFMFIFVKIDFCIFLIISSSRAPLVW